MNPHAKATIEAMQRNDVRGARLAHRRYLEADAERQVREYAKQGIHVRAVPSWPHDVAAIVQVLCGVWLAGGFALLVTDVLSPLLYFPSVLLATGVAIFSVGR
jgi:hypothetical protein